MEASVAQLVVRNLDDDVKAKLQQRARRHGRSTEEEVRDILRNAVREQGAPLPPLGSRLRARFARIGLEEDIPELRGQPAKPAAFDA
jgi:plasmid stability protein